MDAVNKSLKNPKILDTKIPKLFVNIALNIGFFCWFMIFLHNFNKSLVKIDTLKIKYILGG